MQVTNSADTATSMVVSKNEAVEFGVSDSPEFFRILSSSLYKNPLEAFIREVICNAWDAHIVEGNTDTPIIISVDNDYLVVEDSGSGIPKNMMQEIYCVYGASTKKSDGRQTGGFGLGCKSPFAYTDNFEVTSYNNGTKTIYRLLLSDPNKDGKPSCTEIISVPTDRTGLTVKVPLDNTSPSRVISVVNDVAYLGSILVNLNDSELPQMPMSTEPNNYRILPPIVADSVLGYSHSIYVRYGNVVYPVTSHQEYRADYDDICSLLKALFGGRGAIIIQAEPDSLAITPSREELSMQDLTVASVSKLLDNFVRKVPNKIGKLVDGIFEKCLSVELQKDKVYQILHHLDASIELEPAGYERPAANANDLTDEDIALLSVHSRSYLYQQRFENVLRKRVKFIINNCDFKDRAFLKASLPNWLKNHVSYRHNSLEVERPLVHRIYHQKALAAWSSEPELQKKPLMVLDRSKTLSRSYSDRLPPFHTITTKLPLRNPFGAMTNKVVISYVKTGIEDRIRNRLNTGNLNGLLVYVLPNKKVDTKQLAIKAFTSAGYTIEDLTVFNEDEKHLEVKQIRTQKERERSSINSGDNVPVITKDGVLALSSVIQDGVMDVRKYRKVTEPVYTKNPKAVIHVPLNKDTRRNRIGLFCGSSLRTVVELFGDEVGIVNLQSQAIKLDTGITLLDLVQTKLEQYVPTCPYIVYSKQRDLLNDYTREFSWGVRDMVRYILNSDTLSNELDIGVKSTPKPKDRALYDLYTDFFSYYDNDVIQKYLESIELDKKLLTQIDTLVTSKVTRMFNQTSRLRDLEEMLKSSDKDEQAAGKYLTKSLTKFIGKPNEKD